MPILFNHIICDVHGVGVGAVTEDKGVFFIYEVVCLAHFVGDGDELYVYIGEFFDVGCADCEGMLIWGFTEFADYRNNTFFL